MKIAITKYLDIEWNEKFNDNGYLIKYRFN
jgi:hypothetical protein